MYFLFNYIVIRAPGPNGNPVIIHIASKSIHPIKNIAEYGTIVEIIVPIPAFLSYFCANTTIIAKYAISGDIILVVESHILYAT